jgi:hypothetical protein
MVHLAEVAGVMGRFASERRQSGAGQAFEGDVGREHAWAASDRNSRTREPSHG